MDRGPKPGRLSCMRTRVIELADVDEGHEQDRARGIETRHVGARRGTSGGDRAAHRVVGAAQLRRRGRDLERRWRARPGLGRVAALPPGLGQGLIGLAPALGAHRAGDEIAIAGGQIGRPGGGGDDHRLAVPDHAGAVPVGGLIGVEDPQTRRRRLFTQRQVGRGQRGVHGRQRERGQEASLGPAMDAQHHAGDEAERALAAAQGAGQVGSGRAPRRQPGVDGAAVGEHGRQPDHGVLEEAVARARLAGCAHRDQPAEGRAQDAGWVVAHRQPARRQHLLEAEPGDPGLHVAEQRGLVEGDDVIEARRRDEHARAIDALDPGRTRRRADRDHRGAVAAGDPHHLGDLGGGAGRDPPGRRSVGAHVLGADRALELADQRAAHRPSFPGFMMSSGSRVRLSPCRMLIASRCSPNMYGALSRPTPWWWLMVPPTRVAASRPSRQIAS